MRKREMGYQEYGFDPGEEKQLKEYCKSADFTDHDILLQAAIFSNPSISADLYYSLVKGLSYDRISNIRYIPLSKVDFYAYQRDCLAKFKNMLDEKGKSGNKVNMCEIFMKITEKSSKPKKIQQISGQISLFDYDFEELEEKLLSK